MPLQPGRRIFPTRALRLAQTFPYPRTEQGLGCAAMLVACIFSALCGAAFFRAVRAEPGVSPLAGILIRVVCNFSCLAWPLLWGAPLPRLRRWQGNRALWCWGVLGVVATTCYYLALPLVGSGLTMFLNAGSGIFVAALGPWLTGQRTARSHWLGALGSCAGLYLLCLAGGGAPGSALGALLALLSGLFGGLAYLLVARRRAAYGPETVTLHWTFVNLLAYLGFVFFYPPRWPGLADTWVLFVAAGLAGAASQFFTALSYQKAPASLAACLCYLSPVLGLALDACLFGLRFGPAELVGAATVLAFGVAMPLLSARRARD
jgi:drug/metabolite transporter (DMT)-like permease